MYRPALVRGSNIPIIALKDVDVFVELIDSIITENRYYYPLRPIANPQNPGRQGFP